MPTPARNAIVRHALILTAIMALGAALRLYRLEDVDIRFDAASAVQQARAIAEGQLTGFAHYSGSVIEHPPLFLYLLALPMLLSRDFLVAAGFHALLDLCAVPVVYVAAARQRWPVAAIVSALLLATGPWATQFARNLGIVTPPVLAALCMWGLLEGVASKRPWGWALASIAAALGAGAHLTGGYLLIVVGAAAVLFRRTVNLRALASGLIPLVILAIAYGASNGTAVATRLSAGTTGLNSSGLALQPLAGQFALWTSGGMHLADLTGPAYLEWIKDPWLVWNWLDALQIGLLIAGLLIASGAPSALDRAETRLRRAGAGMGAARGAAAVWRARAGDSLRHPSAASRSAADGHRRADAA